MIYSTIILISLGVLFIGFGGLEIINKIHKEIPKWIEQLFEDFAIVGMALCLTCLLPIIIPLFFVYLIFYLIRRLFL